MRTLLRVIPLAFVGACANACAITKALYVAVVHNSGAPPRAERDAIDARQRAMLRELPNKRVLILPVAVLGRDTQYDSVAARALADELNRDSLAQARVAVSPVVLPFEAQPNEALTLWTRFNALADSVRAHPPAEFDYVLLVDVFGPRAFAVHAMGVTARGEMAYVNAWNSHQAFYKEVKPQNVNDAVRMVALDIRRGTR
jgi:hypothetical protein